MIPGWLLHGDLPPVGNPIVFDAANYPPLHFDGYTMVGVQSGTAALALALLITRQRHPHIETPTVILPAYGCPDLIAAAEYAGVRPVLVDISIDDPSYDLEQLARAIDNRTIAVVAVNFLGVRERLIELREILTAHPHVSLIEDNAQWFPEPINGAHLLGDMVCLSFGRGKPVSLLGGGMLLVNNNLGLDVPAVAAAQPSGKAFSLKTWLLNLLLKPRFFPLINRNPLIELGLTRFKPLTVIRALDERRMQMLPAAVAHYLARSRAIEKAWQQAIAQLPEVYALAVDPQRRGRLLRYPLLTKSADVRAALWRQLDAAGLGATAMYRCALPEVHGVDGKFDVFADYPNARSFAARLLTLPTHAQVTPAAVERMRAIISDNRF